MKKTLQTAFIFTILLCFLQKAHAAELPRVQAITVGGFVSRGGTEDGNINMVLSKTLISYLSKIRGSRVTSFEEVEKRASETGLWKQNQQDLDKKMMGTAQRFGSKQVLFGYYTADKKTNKLSLDILVYDVVTGELYFHRTFEGVIGLQLLDTADHIAINIAGLLYQKELSVSHITLSLTNTSRLYSLFINGKKESDLSNGVAYEGKVIAGEETELSLRLYSENPSVSGKECLRKLVILNKGVVLPVVYEPAGVLFIQSLVGPGQVLLDGFPAGKIDSNETFSLPGVKADLKHTIQLTAQGKVVSAKEISVSEGGSAFAVMLSPAAEKKLKQRQTNPSAFHYENSTPPLNLVVPGFAQYQAGDYLLGGIFTAAGYAGLGMTVFSGIGLYITQDKYSRSVFPDDKTAYSDASKAWLGILIGSGVVWIGTAVFSMIYSYSQIADMNAEKMVLKEMPPVSLCISGERIAFEYTVLF